jgi:preprotein translocase subunit Sss1
MIDPQIGRAAFRIAIFITGVALVLLPLEERDSAEFYVSLVTAFIGLAAIGVIVFVVRWFRR